MTDKDNPKHGQTYGEAVDEVQRDIAEKVSVLEDGADSLRDEGGVVNLLVARYFERQAKELKEASTLLEEKRRKMPFGLESAQGFGETMDNPAISFAEEMQRDADSDDE